MAKKRREHEPSFNEMRIKSGEFLGNSPSHAGEAGVEIVLKEEEFLVPWIIPSIYIRNGKVM